MKLDQNSFREDNSGEKFSPWTTYSDIFCSLMMVFVLLFSYAMIQYSLSDLKKEAETEQMIQASRAQEQSIIELQALQSDYEAQIIVLQQQLEDAEIRAEAQPQIISLQSELSNAQYDLQIIMAEKRDLQTELDNVSAELADLMLISEDQSAELDEQRSQLIILNAENADLQEQIDALTSKNADLEARILLLDADIARMQEESDGKGELEDQKAQLIALTDHNDELEAQLILLNNRNTDLNAQIAAAQEEIASLTTEIEKAEDQIAQLQNMIVVFQGNSDTMSIQIVDLEAENADLAAQNSDLRARLAALTAETSDDAEEAVAGIRLEIITELRNALDASGVEARVDGETGAIMLNSEVLFAVNESALKPEGRAFLDKFFPAYFDVLAKGDSAKYIAEILVEGHTDTSGTYLTNLDLSMRRAESVVAYCVSLLSPEDQEIMIQLITASGCAYANPVYKDDGSVDMDRSRRVEMKFTLKDASMIEEMQRAFGG